MFVRAKRRFKDGKEHRYWSVVENCRNPDGRVVQRQVLYLGEINDSERAAWCRVGSIDLRGEKRRFSARRRCAWAKTVSSTMAGTGNSIHSSRGRTARPVRRRTAPALRLPVRLRRAGLPVPTGSSGRPPSPHRPRSSE